MWYPQRSRIEELSRALHSCEGAQPENNDAFLIEISAAIRHFSQFDLLSSYLLRDWVWIGSQYRIHSNNSVIHRVAGRFLVYLCSIAGDETEVTEELCMDLNWTTGSTISLLEKQLGSESFGSFLSADEKRSVDKKLDTMNLKDVGDLELEISPYIKRFSDVSSQTYLPYLCNEITKLLDVAVLGDENSELANKALVYLTEPDDVVPDRLGYFGLVDDIYVIENVFGKIEGKALWAPILSKYEEMWPCIQKIVFDDSSKSVKLSSFSQMVAGAALTTLFGGGDKKMNIVLPEKGPSASIIALLSIVSSIRNQSVQQLKAIDSLEKGDHVVLGGGGLPVNAIFEDRRQEDNGMGFYWIKLARDLRVSLGREAAIQLRKSPRPHGRLSSLKKFNSWKSNYRPFALSSLFDQIVNLDVFTPETLFVTKKQNLDQYQAEILPMGESITSLVGIKYFTKAGVEKRLSGNQLAEPLLYSCSDPLIATQIMIGELPSAIGFVPKYIVVDGAHLAEALFQHLDESMVNDECRIVAISSLYEREACKNIESAGFSSWLINNNDVNPVFEDHPYESSYGEGALSRYFERQFIQEVSGCETHTINDTNIEYFASCLEELRNRDDLNNDHYLNTIALLASITLGKIRMCLSTSDRSEFSDIVNLLNNLKEKCSVLLQFDDEVRQLYEVSDLIIKDGLSDVRGCAVDELIEGLSEGKHAVLCHSQNAALFAKENYSRKSGSRSDIAWVSIRELRNDAPFDTIIVPGWLNRKIMREVSAAGYALKTHYILFPFEAQWYETSRKAGDIWKKRLLSKHGERWKDQERVYGKVVENSEDLFAAAADNTLEDFTEYPQNESEISHSEWAEQLVRQVITGGEGQKDDHPVHARLTMFDEPGMFIYLPPYGKVICLNEIIGANTSFAGSSDKSNAIEKLINKDVCDIKQGDLLAFPESGTGDLLDVLADKMMKHADEVRGLAGLWKKSLIEYSEKYELNISQLRGLLKSHGLERGDATISHWVSGQCTTIAPAYWKKEIPIIAEFTGHEVLRGRLNDVLSSIELIYSKRREAAVKLVSYLADKDIDFENGKIAVDIDGASLLYRVMTVRAIDPVSEVSNEIVGRLQSALGASL